ncbi:hypothetical protein B4110_0449 [Parageobacillus toebii]|uniref:Uncharacterized protein n=1 Tax=Parageobacillus toebii TaxID=153151 RepID=A0A150MAY6_9BACL|nr:hypothetical protein B4110_0449 [Parageobacillus toebii]
MIEASHGLAPDRRKICGKLLVRQKLNLPDKLILQIKELYLFAAP